MKKINRKYIFILMALFVATLFFVINSQIYAQGPVCTTEGLIPCGRNCDDGATPWFENNPCDLCSMILMGQLVIEFLLKISAVAAVLAIAFGGILYIFAAGSSGTIDKAKSIIKYVLLGFLIVFIAWALVDTILAMFGYIDPVGGDWYTINC